MNLITGILQSPFQSCGLLSVNMALPVGRDVHDKGVPFHFTGVGALPATHRTRCASVLWQWHLWSTHYAPSLLCWSSKQTLSRTGQITMGTVHFKGEVHKLTTLTCTPTGEVQQYLKKSGWGVNDTASDSVVVEVPEEGVPWPSCPGVTEQPRYRWCGFTSYGCCLGSGYCGLRSYGGGGSRGGYTLPRDTVQ
jgi:hypothetical protein